MKEATTFIYVFILFIFVALVSFGKVTPEQKQEVEKFGLTMYSWEEFLEVVGYLSVVLLLFFLPFVVNLT